VRRRSADWNPYPAAQPVLVGDEQATIAWPVKIICGPVHSPAPLARPLDARPVNSPEKYGVWPFKDDPARVFSFPGYQAHRLAPPLGNHGRGPGRDATIQ
jgi:hypothetical protein